MAITIGSVWLALVGAAFVGLVMPSVDGLFLVVGVLALFVGVDVLLAAGRRQVQVVRGQGQTELELGGRASQGTVTRLRLGQTATLPVQLVNLHRRPARLVIRDLWVPSAFCTPHHQHLTVPAQSAKWTSFTVRPTRRGSSSSRGFAVRSLGPLHLAARQWQVQLLETVQVLPAFTSRAHLPSRLAMLRELEGKATVLRKGQGSEFDSLREYVVGDDVRDIDWISSARQRQVVVRTWRPQRDRRVLIVVDCSRTSAARIASSTGATDGANQISVETSEAANSDTTRLDALIEAAMLLAALAGQAGDRVELLAYDTAIRAQVRGERPAQLLPSLSAALGQVQPNLVEADMTGLVSTVLQRTRRRSLVVLLTSVEPASISSGLLPVLPLLTSRNSVIVAAVQDPRVQQLAAAPLVSSAPERAAASAAGGASKAKRRVAAEQVYQRASAAMSLQATSQVHELLHNRGAEVVSELPEQLPPALADRYLALKAAGRL